MIPCYRIAIAHDERDIRASLHDRLTHAGHEVIIETSSGEELINRCTSATSDSVQLVVTDVKLNDMDGLAAAAKIVENRDVPFIIVTGTEDDQVIEASANRVFAYLLKPIRDVELKAAIHIAMQRFMELQSYRLEATTMRQALEDRKVVEQAKGILMRDRGLDESSAFNLLQKLARDHRQKLVDVARSIILVEDIQRTE